MINVPALLLIGAVVAVGVLHTIVPDHWVPIVLIARQRGWSRGEIARASLQAGVGHVLSTLVIAAVVWLAGAALADRFGRAVDAVSSLALIAFGGWIAVAAWRDLHRHNEHGHHHHHGNPGGTPGAGGHHHGSGPGVPAGAGDDIHGPERQRISTATGTGIVVLSIFEAGAPPRFRFSGVGADAVTAEIRRETGARQRFLFANHGTYWESVEEVPEPHQFDVAVTITRDGRSFSCQTRFTEQGFARREPRCGSDGHAHAPTPADDPLYVPLQGETAVLTRHFHVHRHGAGAGHAHWHDHVPATAHAIDDQTECDPPRHDHRHKTTARTALLLILGSSPMVEGIPAFFAAGKYGAGLIAVMAVLFAISTIATYVLLCVYSAAGLQRIRFGAFERYGEILSGAFIVFVGCAFWIWPVL